MNKGTALKKLQKKLMGLAIEVAVVFFFKNFTYRFAGETFLQLFGGPIGARLTMAVAKLVMQEWKEKFDEILMKSDIEELLSGLYVDDGRSVQRKLAIGERFDEKERKFTVKEEWRKCDLESGRNRDELTRTEVLKAMNAVNEDLEFTMELCTDFSDNKLPTLSFSLFYGEEGLEHTYFKKSMRNQTLLMSRSSMGKHQLMSIMTNELRRRMEVKGEKLKQNEKNDIINKYTQQLVNSEFKWRQIRKIIVSGITGHIRTEKKMYRDTEAERTVSRNVQRRNC